MIVQDPRPAHPLRPPRLPWHSRGIGVALAVSVVGSLAALALLALVLVPGLTSALAAETADGARSYGIGAYPAAVDHLGAAVTPEAGWQVRQDGSASAHLSDGEPAGLLVLSPDRVLTVRFAPEDAPAGGAASIAGLANAQVVRSEVLASGLELRLVIDGNRFVGVLETSGGPIRVEAWVSGSADLERYRPALAALLERVG